MKKQFTLVGRTSGRCALCWVLVDPMWAASLCPLGLILVRMTHTALAAHDPEEDGGGCARLRRRRLRRGGPGLHQGHCASDVAFRCPGAHFTLFIHSCAALCTIRTHRARSSIVVCS